jgi:dTDP-4-amino-4,6-dideoxygalactose transaminase
LLDVVVGEEPEELHEDAKMSNVDAALARAQLRSLHKNTKQRRDNSEILLKALDGNSGYIVPNLSSHDAALKLIVVLPASAMGAEEAAEYLRSAKVECQRGYAPLHLKMGSDGSFALLLRSDPCFMCPLGMPA